jgi:hypothetical protein
MDEKFLIGDYGSENVGALAEFISEEYPAGEISDERFLEWEYFSNPAGKALITIASDKQGIIASQYALIPVEFIVDGKVITGSLSLNTLTGTAFRGLGLFQKTAGETYARCAAAGIFFTIGVPNKSSFRGFTKRLNFTHAGDLTFLVKPLRPLEILRSVVVNNQEKKGKDIPVRMNEFKKDSRVSPFDPQPDQALYDVFRERWKNTSPISTNRTTAYLHWRYSSNPLRNYHMFKEVENGEMHALAVVRVLNVYGMRTCVLMEFCCLGDGKGRALLTALAGAMRNNDIDIMACTAAAKKNEYQQLKKSGYYPVPEFLLPQRLPFIARVHREFDGSQRLTDLNNWHFAFGDFDIF